jgi:hypothetical protein
MRNLNRNKRLIYYALRTGDTPILDEYGNETGEFARTFTEPTALYCSVSAAQGEDAVQAFGSFTGYSRTLCVADTSCPIDEDSIVWFGVPETEPHNYIVVLKADSKNGVLYALQEVTVT